MVRINLVAFITRLAPQYIPHVAILLKLPEYQLEAWYERLRHQAAGGSGDVWDGEWDAGTEHERQQKKRKW